MKLGRLALGLLLTAWWLIACDSPSIVPTTPTPSLSALPTGIVNVSSVSVGGQAVIASGTAQFTAIATLAGGATVAVTNQASWQSSNSAVLTVTNAGLVTVVGSGSADVTAAFQGKTGKLTVAVRVPCVTNVTPPSQFFNAEGGIGTLNVTAPAGCIWSVQNGATFVTLTGGSPGTGNGTVTYRVASNASGAQRSAALVIEAFQIGITQDVPTGTYLSFISDAGDFIGQGKTFVGVSPTTSFTITIDAPLNHLTVSTVGSDGLSTVNWDLHLQAVQSPSTQQLSVGTYLNATRWPFQAPTVPGLSFSGSGRGCNVLSGNFAILDAAYAGQSVTRFLATFEQHCEGFAPALRGKISINE